MQSLYIISIKDKYFKKLLNYKINIIKIKHQKDYYLLYLDYPNYQKIKNLKKRYEIKLVSLKGKVKYQKIFKTKFSFFLSFLIAIFLIIFLANTIFFIEIKTTNPDIKKLLEQELTKNGISLYKFQKSYQEKEKIKKKILENNKDKIEWLEITKIGSKYVVEVTARIIKEIADDNAPQDIVALKNAIILKIDAKSGSILKKLNDYVKAGDIIVTGSITHKDKVVDLVKADATIYGETWYNVHVSYPLVYYEKKLTGKSFNKLSLTLFNKKLNLFNNKKYSNEQIIETKLIYHKFLPLKLSYNKVLEVLETDNVYTYEEALEQAIKKAQEKLLQDLSEDAKILSQKKLKIIINDSTIDADIFFKVYENITAIKKIANNQIGE